MSKPSTPKPTTGNNSPAATFSARMQDAQARNKDPYASSSSDSESCSRFDSYGNDTYESLTSRREAAVILDSPELLMMHAQARGDSITATRHHFAKQLCGYLPPDPRKGGDVSSEESPPEQGLRLNFVVGR